MVLYVSLNLIHPNIELEYTIDQRCSRRYGHASLMKTGGLDLPVALENACENYIAFKRVPFNCTMPLEPEPLALVTADLFGPVTATHLGKQYMLLFTDFFSRYTVAYCFLVTKRAAAEYFVTYRAWAEKQTGKNLRRLHTDGEGEFVIGKIKTAC